MASPEIERMMRDIERETRLTAPITGIIELSPEVLRVMRLVPRHEFVPKESRVLAYANRPAEIGYGQTISQPYIVALMTSLLELRPHHVVLEIGTGSAYQTAILTQLSSRVYSMEVIEPLLRAGTERLSRLGYTNVETRLGDGYLGWPEHAPYDGIIVTAAAEHIPLALVDQLVAGGTLVIPVANSGWGQDLMCVCKHAPDNIQVKKIIAVSFVPLTGDAHNLPFKYQ